MGGAEWLTGSDPDRIEAVVCPDPTGDTEDYFWAVNDHTRGDHYDDYTIAEGQHSTIEAAKAAAQAAINVYEEHVA
jgi:hypothetical protein